MHTDDAQPARAEIHIDLKNVSSAQRLTPTVNRECHDAPTAGNEHSTPQRACLLNAQIADPPNVCMFAVLGTTKSYNQMCWRKEAQVSKVSMGLL